jgi:hypothetical protein
MAQGSISSICPRCGTTVRVPIIVIQDGQVVYVDPVDRRYYCPVCKRSFR